MKHQEINGKLTLDSQVEFQLLAKLLRQEHRGVTTSLERAILPELQSLQDLCQSQQQQLDRVLEELVLLQQTASQLDNNLQQVKQSYGELPLRYQDTNSRDLFLEKARFYALEKKFKQVLLWCQISTLSGAVALGIFGWSKIERPQISQSRESFTFIAKERSIVPE